MKLRGLSDLELSRLSSQVRAEQKRRQAARPAPYGGERNPLSDMDRVMLGIVRDCYDGGHGAPSKADLLKRASPHMARVDAQGAFTRLREADIIYFDTCGYVTMWGSGAIGKGWIYGW